MFNLSTIKALDLGDVTSSLPEDDAPTYNAGTTYNIADLVIDDHYVYGCLVDGTVGKKPSDFSSRFQTPQYWQLRGPTNAYAAFDNVLSVPSVNTSGDMTFTIESLSNISSVGIFDAIGVTATAQFHNSDDDLIDTQSVNLTGFDLSSHYNWLFTQPTAGNTNYLFRRFPANSVKVVVTIAGDATELGELTINQIGYVIGDALYGSSVRISSRAKYDDDEFGVPSYVYKPSRINGTFEIFGERDFIETLWGRLRKLSGRRVVYEADEGRTVTTGIGLVRDITVPIDLPGGYKFSIETEGVQ
ncbi:hypothetical protein AN189_17670 [Loktanella sp. 3ANDIMAR09]|uniref:hypothetical protein n=1 Tax=Loktanella sp. 3ANDIMAR09 TaxID=1225657 RepID=UPI0007006AD3|nr:hypothetical protein [Loktanella sp. 3ANDIMAR09]KQI67051.1 hypothetical protein AN189_17670 [Loktanella sp. 3ANDIMAR09]